MEQSVAKRNEGSEALKDCFDEGLAGQPGVDKVPSGKRLAPFSVALACSHSLNSLSQT